MTQWLASVQSIEEAEFLLPVHPDIIDMKNPSQGALGALSVATVTEIVSMINDRCKTSATIGDLAMDSELIAPAIVQMATSGVDYVKIGLFPDQNIVHCIAALAHTIKKLKTPVIAVIFADRPLKQAILPALKASGFYGVMIDTALKDGRHLLDHMDRLRLMEFIEQANKQQLICGLAGALRYEDIAVLTKLGADYLGFRSALCVERHRTATLDLKRIETISQAMLNQ